MTPEYDIGGQAKRTWTPRIRSGMGDLNQASDKRGGISEAVTKGTIHDEIHLCLHGCFRRNCSEGFPEAAQPADVVLLRNSPLARQPPLPIGAAARITADRRQRRDSAKARGVRARDAEFPEALKVLGILGQAPGPRCPSPSAGRCWH